MEKFSSGNIAARKAGLGRLMDSAKNAAAAMNAGRGVSTDVSDPDRPIDSGILGSESRTLWLTAGF